MKKLIDKDGAPYFRPENLKEWTVYWFNHFIGYRLWSFYNKYIPRLVWRRDPVEVRITINTRKVNYDDLFAAEKALRKLGIRFDTGMGGGERDWEFDYSLTGPVKVTFSGRANYKKTNPEGIFTCDTEMGIQECVKILSIPKGETQNG